jgi:hypothetical protein
MAHLMQHLRESTKVRICLRFCEVQPGGGGGGAVVQQLDQTSLVFFRIAVHNQAVYTV